MECIIYWTLPVVSGLEVLIEYKNKILYEITILYPHTHTHIYTHIHTYTHTYIYTHAHTYIYTCRNVKLPDDVSPDIKLACFTHLPGLRHLAITHCGLEDLGPLEGMYVRLFV